MDTEIKDFLKSKEKASALILGDCLEKMSSIPDKFIDLILCDLPYGRTQNRWDSVLPLEKLWTQYERIIKDSGAILLFAQTPFDKILGASNVKLLRYEWIWEKTNPTGFLNAKKAPLKAHENILVFYKKLPAYHPQKTSGHPKKKATRVSHSTNYGDTKRETTYESTERYPRSVIKFPSDKQKENFHPTQKPVELLEYLIRTYSEPGEIVLDNTMGSGSTGVAAIRQGRRFIGIELYRKYFQIAKERIGSALDKVRNL